MTTCERLTLTTCEHFISDCLLLQSNLLKWIALGPDYKCPLMLCRIYPFIKCSILFIASEHTHTHTLLMALFPGLPEWAGTRKVKPIWILLKQETVSGSGISWAICKSAPGSRQITMPAPHPSDFYRPHALPAAQPTASKHWRHIASEQDKTNDIHFSTLSTQAVSTWRGLTVLENKVTNKQKNKQSICTQCKCANLIYNDNLSLHFLHLFFIFQQTTLIISYKKATFTQLTWWSLSICPHRRSIFAQRLWSYDLMALYKSVYYYYYISLPLVFCEFVSVTYYQCSSLYWNLGKPGPDYNRKWDFKFKPFTPNPKLTIL